MNTDSTVEVPVGCVETPPRLVNEITRAKNLFCRCPATVVATISDFGFRTSFGLRPSGFGFRRSPKLVPPVVFGLSTFIRGQLVCAVRAITALLTMLAPWCVKGDGGVVQLRESQGPFSVTVFAAPETTRDGLTDVSVLVQWKKNGEVVLDADVSLALDSPNTLAMDRSEPLCGVSPPATAIQSVDKGEPRASVPATREQASNKLLYAAALKLNTTGRRRLRVKVVRGAESASFDCPLLVTQTSAKLAVLWPCLAFPPIAIMAFAMNQWLRRDSLEKGLERQSTPSLIHDRPRARIERTSKFCFAKL